MTSNFYHCYKCILTAQDWLEKTPEPAAPQKATEKLYKRNSDGSLVWVIK